MATEDNLTKEERKEKRLVEKEERKANKEEKKEERKANKEEKKEERKEEKKEKKEAREDSRVERRKQRLKERRERKSVRLKQKKTKNHTKRRVSMFGELTVSGEGDIIIPIRGGKPEKAEARFVGEMPPKMGCGPITEDTLTVTLEKQFPFPIWQVRLAWNVKSGNVRGLEWSVNVIR